MENTNQFSPSLQGVPRNVAPDAASHTTSPVMRLNAATPVSDATTARPAPTTGAATAHDDDTREDHKIAPDGVDTSVPMLPPSPAHTVNSDDGDAYAGVVAAKVSAPQGWNHSSVPLNATAPYPVELPKYDTSLASTTTAGASWLGVGSDGGGEAASL